MWSPYRLIARALAERRGSVAVVFALTAPILIGFTSLGVEVGYWYLKQDQAQHMVDAAAQAGARELAAGTGKYEDAVKMAAELNGCLSDCSVTDVSVFKYGDSTVDNGVEVKLGITVDQWLSALFLQSESGTITIAATSKAIFESKTETVQTSSGGGAACVLGLDDAAPFTVWLKNNATLKCGAMSNSKCQGPNSPTCALDSVRYGSYSCSSSIDPQCNISLSNSTISSMYLWNNARIEADAAAAGIISLGNNAVITGTKSQSTTQVSDPYASVTLSVPTSTAAATVAGGNGSSGTNAIDISIASGKCSTAAITYSNNKYLKIHPGCYNGWDFMNNVVIVLDAGTYYLKTKFKLSNNSRIVAPAQFSGNTPTQLGSGGTTIVLVGSGSSSYAMDIGNNAILTIRAPNDGTFKGIAFMSDPSAKENLVQTFSNNATLNVLGAIYFPRQILNMENNAISNSSGCLQLVARRVLFSNNATLGSNCSTIGTADLQLGEIVTTTTTTVTTTNIVE